MTRWILLFLWSCGALGVLQGQQAIPGSASNRVAATDIDPALIPVPEDAALPRVLIVGDSISMGYTPVVRKELSGLANVQHPPVNCESSENGVKHIAEWLGSKNWDVIYFNFGLHDLKYLDSQGRYVSPKDGKQVASPDIYAKNLKAVVELLRTKSKAKLIFATTTPVPSGARGRIEGDEARYNAAALEVMHSEGVEVDDLHAVVMPELEKLQQSHNVHYTSEGYQRMGAEVSARIKHALKTGIDR